MHVAIVGNGIAGVTAARVVRRARPGWRVSMISDESAEPLARTAWMYVYMGHLTLGQTRLYEPRFWDDNRIERVHDRVDAVDPEANTLALRSGGELGYDRLLIATGSVPAFHGWPGQELGGVQGLYSLQDLDRMKRDTAGVRHAVVLGGGLIGVEMAEMLHTRGIGVTYLVREGRYLAHGLPERESRLVEAEIRSHGIDLRLGTELDAILGDGRVRAVRTSAGDEVRAEWVGIATGVRPNVAWLAGAGIETARGVLVGPTLETNVPGVFAAGDCVELREPPPGRPARQPIWYTGREQGAVAAAGLVGAPRAYAPGVFFNSAAFFGVEWQTYGDVAVEPTADRRDLVVEGPGPGGRTRMVRLQGDAASGRLLGVNGLGLRLRQRVCAAWIRDGVSLDDASARLPEALFDPEFSPSLAA